MPNSSHLNVLFIASEAEPLIKVGGLGDVAGSLPIALRSLNRLSSELPYTLDVRLAIPYHPGINSESYRPRRIAEFPIHASDGDIMARAFSLEVDGLPVYLIGGSPIDNETSVYSTNLEADGFKYVFFSLATLALMRILDWKPDILHANDWHTAPAVYSLALQRPTDPIFSHTSSVLTIHNLPYLGSMSAPALEAFGLPLADKSDLPQWAQHLALPLGLLAADAIVAVSPGYSQEILTEEFGSGLHAFLSAHKEKISGILNGLDTHRWNPGTDEELSANFSPDNLLVRAANKTFLQKETGLEINPHIPLIAMVTRMDPQKGVDLAVSALRSLLKSTEADQRTFQAIFLGTGNPALENLVRKLEKNYPERIRAKIMYNEQFSRYIYGGADILLMPSRYEPCGLSQMIAMHYGCVPVARATGGLIDTIQDASTADRGTGFLFQEPTSAALAEAIMRAFVVYKQYPHHWQEIQIQGMQQDFSWYRSAMEYLNRYRMLVG